MLKLRSITKSAPGGFVFQDRATGWRHHSWSFNDTVKSWYQENVKRGTGRTRDQCSVDVEAYMCEKLIGTDGWQQWVILEEEPVAYQPFTVPPPPPELTVSVVIPVYRVNLDRLLKTVNSVLPQVSEVVVVTDDVWPEEHPNPKVKFLSTGKKDTGFGEKNNLGAKASTGQFIWFLNDDCYPNPGCADAMLEIMADDPKAGAVGHLLRYPDGRIQHGGTHREAGKAGFPHLDHGSLALCSIRSAIECEAITGASMMVRREAFEAVQGFCEDYFLYLEDSDLCLQMRQSGWKVFYTPFAEGIHEEHQSSLQRSDLQAIIARSVATFTERSFNYFQRYPVEPKFDPIDLSSIDVVYVHLVGDRGSEELAQRFVQSAHTYPPGRRVNWVIALNHNNGLMIKPEIKAMFDSLGSVAYFDHDNSGWDIGAYQAYSKVSTAKIVLFFGSSAYCRKHGWINPVLSSFRKHGPHAIYGTCGHLGDPNGNISPHIRTTGFWCSPSVFNRYPTTVNTKEGRYPFEHGSGCLTVWAWSQGMQVLIVDSDGTYGYPKWNDGPNGYHRGNQSSLLFGDRLCCPPYFAIP